ncbi:MAG: cellulase family glycosylhydrolase [Anaerolineae bacterium]|nr:cellulase family glycosylhydrolase [Anaerolineae bacterium]
MRIRSGLLMVVALLVLWGTRLNVLELLPLHNDEGLHLTRAVEVWNAHPFWAISDGKIVNHWLIAAFYPQHAPVFAGRVATIFVAMLGMAAGMALARRFSGGLGAALTAALWIACPYLFFYERLAFSDAEAGALATAAIFFSFQFSVISFQKKALNNQLSSKTTHYSSLVTQYSVLSTQYSVLLCGLFLAAAMLFKFTAAPYALSVAIIVLLASNRPIRHRLISLGLIGITVALCFAVPLGYLLLKGDDLFAIAFGWIGGSSGGQPALVANLERLWAQLSGFGSFTWVILTLVGLLFLVSGFRFPVSRKDSSALSNQQKRGTRDSALSTQYSVLLLSAALLPLLLILVLGREVLSRHFVVTLPLLLTVAGAGLGRGLTRIRDARSRQMIAAMGVVGLAFGVMPFMLTAYANPAALPLPEDARYEHITSHSSGYGLSEAVAAFPQTIAARDLPIIASMFPDSCRRANFYAAAGFAMQCADAPGLPQIEAALSQRGAVYVLVDDAPNIGIDVTTINARATPIAAYPRPGESPENASVVLWLLENPDSASASITCSVESAQAAQAALSPYAPSTVQDFVVLQNGEFSAGGVSFVARGVNYYPARYPWRRFLTQADLQTVDSEFTLMRGAGLNTLRIFLWNEALFTCPQYGAVPIVDNFARLDAIIHNAAQQGFRLIVTLNDLPDLENLSLYDNLIHTIAQTQFIIERYRDEAAILAWDLRNEGDIDYGSLSPSGGKFPRQIVLDWLSQTAAQVRERDSNHLITAGWLHDAGATAPDVDFVSFHHWEDAARMRDRLAEIRAVTDKPVLLEEFGYSTFRVSPEDQARLLTEVSTAAESEGLLGWLVWTAFDFPLDATCTPPACPSLDNAEHHFGLGNADYTPKASVDILNYP